MHFIDIAAAAAALDETNSHIGELPAASATHNPRTSCLLLALSATFKYMLLRLKRQDDLHSNFPYVVTGRRMAEGVSGPVCTHIVRLPLWSTWKCFASAPEMPMRMRCPCTP